MVYKSPQCFLPSFKTNDFLAEEKKQNIDFQDGCHNSYIGFPTGKILAIFDLQVTKILSTSFKSIGFWFHEKKRKTDFQNGHHGGHFGFPIGTILAIFDLQVTLMPPTKFRVNWPRGVGGVGF